jgi:hypothetical protein
VSYSFRRILLLGRLVSRMAAGDELPASSRSYSLLVPRKGLAPNS